MAKLESALGLAIGAQKEAAGGSVAGGVEERLRGGF
jgi:hypothetical protein